MEKKKETFDDIADLDTELDIDMDEVEAKSKSKASKPTPKTPEKNADDFSEDVLEMSEDIPVKVSAVLGKKKMVLKDLLKMKMGALIDLDRPPNEFVDIEANGKVIARGELVEIDGKLGVRIIKLLK